MAWLQDVLPAVTDAEPDEAVPVGWAFLYFFCLLCGYYILRPVRDEMVIEGGVQHLPWMMTATFVTLLLVTPLFGWLSARVPRYRLLLIVYAFFGLNLVLFFVAMMSHLSPQWAARTFFVWLSVFNLFVVSVFWSVMADLFTPAQGARLFGVIAAGGSIGAMVGPLLTTGLTYRPGVRRHLGRIDGQWRDPHDRSVGRVSRSAAISGRGSDWRSRRPIFWESASICSF